MLLVNEWLVIIIYKNNIMTHKILKIEILLYESNDVQPRLILVGSINKTSIVSLAYVSLKAFLFSTGWLLSSFSSTYRHVIGLKFYPIGFLQARNYAARKGTREKARKKKIKEVIQKVSFIPHNKRKFKR